jgi:hypothetical protein
MSNNSTKVCGPLVMLVMLHVGNQPVRAGIVYDAAADFSPTSNPNGVWSYGTSPPNVTSFVLGGNPGNYNGVDYWINDPHIAVPAVTHNGTGSPIYLFGSVLFQPGELGFHPGSDNTHAVIRFTAPTSDSYALSTAFSGLDYGPTTTDVHVLVNGTSIFDFSVGFGENGNYYGDTTGVEATLTSGAVPEPASLVVWSVIGLAVTAGCFWRRRTTAALS